MRLVQFKTEDGARQVGLVNDDGRSLQVLRNTVRVYDLALESEAREVGLEKLVQSHLGNETVDYAEIIAQDRLLLPLDHPDPAHFIISGTGLDHLGSAQARDSMHTKLNSGELTDSMKMFKLGLEGGKPAAGQVGVAPEWFYKGDGSWVVPPGQALELPAFALDGGKQVGGREDALIQVD